MVRSKSIWGERKLGERDSAWTIQSDVGDLQASCAQWKRSSTPSPVFVVQSERTRGCRSKAPRLHRKKCVPDFKSISEKRRQQDERCMSRSRRRRI